MKIVRTWLQHPNSNYGIIVMAANENEQESLLGFLSPREERQEWRPRLELTVQVPDEPIFTDFIYTKGKFQKRYTATAGCTGPTWSMS